MKTNKYFLIILTLILLLLFQACGKKGDPLPDSKRYVKAIGKVVLCPNVGVIKQ